MALATTKLECFTRFKFTNYPYKKYRKGGYLDGPYLTGKKVCTVNSHLRY